MRRRLRTGAPSPLEKDGPIVSRARASLLRVATEFGQVTAKNGSQVTVRTDNGLTLRLSYEYGNYLFSRVYNLAVSVDLPKGSPIPSGLRLSHRKAEGPRFRSASAEGTAAAVQLERSIGKELAEIDLASATTHTSEGTVRLTLTPLGGAFVWVLLPPVFKTIAFPAGEIERIESVLSIASAMTAHSSPS
jgi:hypothetical protein